MLTPLDQMDPKKSPRRTKRQSKVLEEFWDCSVCTYRNTDEAFKCLMCDVRKGTSTRKPRLNSQLVAQQAATAGGSTAPATTNGSGSSSSSLPAAASSNNLPHHSNNHHYHKPGSNSSTSKMHRHGSGTGDSGVSKHKQKFARLKNVDRSTAQTREVTVNSLTVVITEYKPKPVRNRRESSTDQSESNDSRS